MLARGDRRPRELRANLGRLAGLRRQQARECVLVASRVARRSPPRGRAARSRWTSGPRARQISTLRRIAPSRAFDSQIRKFNRLAA
jgi:hypothetical protein